MSNRPGRQKRPSGLPATFRTSFNLTESSAAIAERAAEALNISRDAYIEALLAKEKFDDRGRPTWWNRRTAPRWWVDPNKQQELPLKTA